MAVVGVDKVGHELPGAILPGKLLGVPDAGIAVAPTQG